MFTNFFAHHSFLNLWPSFLDHFPSFWKNILRISLFKLSLVFVMYERKCESISCVWLFATPWYVAHQTPLSVEFSKQEYWSGLSVPSPEDLPNPWIEPGSSALRAYSLPSEPLGKPLSLYIYVPNSSHSSFFLRLFFFFSCGSFLKSLLNLSQYYFCFVFLATGMWNLSSLTRDGSHTPCIGSWNLNYWSFRDVPTSFFEDSFAAYVILAWQLFSLGPLSILFCYLLFPTLVVKQSLLLNCCFFVSDKAFLSDCLKKKKFLFPGCTARLVGS